MNVLILGEPDSGKSNLLGMLDVRWTTGAKARVIRSKSNTKIKPITNTLLSGNVIDRSTGKHKTGIWHLGFNQKAFDLVLPEYTGEEFDKLKIDSPDKWDPEWHSRVEDSVALILIIRPDKIEACLDIGNSHEQLSKLENIKTKKIKNKAQQENVTSIPPMSRSDLNTMDLQYVDFLQHCLQVKNLKRRQQQKLPLAVMLSCWDELSNLNTLTPKDKLKELLPWLASYIEGAWHPNYVRVYGLSSLGDHGKNLVIATKNNELTEEQKKSKNIFLTSLKEQGWLIMPDGAKEADLTEPLAWFFESIEL